MINTCEEWDGNAAEYKQLGIEQLIIETIDYTAPLLSDIEKAVEKMRSFLAHNPEKKVYVHCKAGRGRSATMLVCYYVAEGNFSPLEANQMLVSKRPQVSKRCWKRKVVKDFVKKYVLHNKKE